MWFDVRMGRLVSFLLLSCMFFVAGCTADRPGPTQTAQVDESGFIVRLQEITANGPPGVALADTQVQIRPVDHPDLPSDFEYAPAGPAFELSLEDGAQPQVPITVTLQMSDQQNRGQLFFVTRDSTTGQWQGLPVVRQGPTAIVEMTHLSTGFFGWIDGVGDTFNKGLNDFLQLRFDPPACLEDRLETDGRAYSVQPNGNGVYACIEYRQAGPVVTVYSNSPFVWRITPMPGEARGLAAVSALDSAQILTLATFNQSVGYEYDSQTLLVPGGNAPVQLMPGITSTVIRADVDAGLGLIAVIAAGVQTALAVYGVAFTPAQLAEVGDCVANVVDIAIDPDPGRVLGTVLGCFGTAVGGAAGVVVGVLTSLSSLLVTNVVGVVGEFTGTNHIEITVESESLGAGMGSFAGIWVGPIDQPGARDYGVVLQLQESSDGNVSGTVAYPELDCSGYLDSATIEGNTLWITEHITQQGSCVPVVPLRLTLDGETLKYQTMDGYNATGTLEREPSP